MKPYTFEQSDALMERAKKVIPGGIYGHQTPLLLTRGAYPSFFARGEGSHIWDVDGNEYIDYMCSYGPIVLGHRHPKVDEAARRQSELGRRTAPTYARGRPRSRAMRRAGPRSRCARARIMARMRGARRFPPALRRRIA